jgi:type III pantothenate kinase
MYLLALDIGNTNVSVGLFDSSRLVVDFRLKTDASRPADEYAALLSSILALRSAGSASFPEIGAVAICSVVPAVTVTMEIVCAKYLGVEPFLVNSAVTDTGLMIEYDPPSSLGADRLVNAYAARELHARGAAEAGRHAACIVADFGTATKLEAVSADGRYIGGVILPGIGISLDALFGRAALLRQIPLTPAPADAIGRNTADALRSGILFGYAAQVDGLVSRFRSEMRQEMVRVIATGGHAPLVAPHSSTIDLTDLNLTVVGLRLLYERRLTGPARPA